MNRFLLRLNVLCYSGKKDHLKKLTIHCLTLLLLRLHAHELLPTFAYFSAFTVMDFVFSPFQIKRLKAAKFFFVRLKFINSLALSASISVST